MAVVQVGIMSMSMHHRRMAVPVTMWFVGVDAGRMFMLVMRVMNVPVIMLKRLVGMIMNMGFGQVQPETEGHQNASA